MRELPEIHQYLCLFPCACEIVVSLPDCGGEPYDKETEICCDDVKHVKGPHDECCGGRIIDTRASACVLGVVVHNQRTGPSGLPILPCILSCD